jgi:hypothetical protein
MFVSALLGFLSLALFFGSFRWMAVIMLAVYSACVLGASMQIALRHGLALLFVLPVVFFSYHLVYGIATVVGLLRFPFARRSSRKPAPALREA